MVGMPDNVSRGSRVPSPNTQKKPTITTPANNPHPPPLGGQRPPPHGGQRPPAPGGHHPSNTNQIKPKVNQVTPAAKDNAQHPESKTQEVDAKPEKGNENTGFFSFLKPRGYLLPCFCCQAWWLRLSCRIFGCFHIIFAIYTLHNILSFKNAVEFCNNVQNSKGCKENGTYYGTKCGDVKKLCHNYKFAVGADVAVTFIAHTTIGVLVIVSVWKRLGILLLISIALLFLQSILQAIITIVYRFPAVAQGIDLGLYDAVNSQSTDKERRHNRKNAIIYFYVRVAVSFCWSIGLSILYFSMYQVIKHNDDLDNYTIFGEEEDDDEEDEESPSFHNTAIQGHHSGGAEAPQTGEALPGSQS